MSWSNVKLADVKIEDKFPPLPEGDFVFTLVPGASYRERSFTSGDTNYSVTELNVSAAIADGEHKGRRVFLTYPDPEFVSPKGKPSAWSAQAMKKLEIALGIDSLPGEDPADYFNRVAGMNATFGMELKKGTYTPQGAAEARVEPQLFSVHPAVPVAA